MTEYNVEKTEEGFRIRKKDLSSNLILLEETTPFSEEHRAQPINSRLFSYALQAATEDSSKNKKTLKHFLRDSLWLPIRLGTRTKTHALDRLMIYHTLPIKSREIGTSVGIQLSADPIVLSNCGLSPNTNPHLSTYPPDKCIAYEFCGKFNPGKSWQEVVGKMGSLYPQIGISLNLHDCPQTRERLVIASSCGFESMPMEDHVAELYDRTLRVYVER